MYICVCSVSVKVRNTHSNFDIVTGNWWPATTNLRLIITSRGVWYTQRLFFGNQPLRDLNHQPKVWRICIFILKIKYFWYTYNAPVAGYQSLTLILELQLSLFVRLDHCPSDIDASFDLIAAHLNQRKYTQKQLIPSYIQVEKIGFWHV